ncbi:hypothetical protein [Macrococcoides caseolyticum]|uniref:Uncharacterized protein n=2 Tax=Macrococcoides caseolyticum TaxID=69966 RepID=A0ACC9MQS8_9STAP|nr:hypothetical protein [Macrococcus caseolyticus]ARQ03914.1 hypothetical protein CA207_06590 [Macrococcus caseolyticus]ARQ04364.1 hypothetical protein CA207_11130 [Macrococcus caseolyticus]PKE07340.1 hypothetical protein CW692_03500 [Macrococcus caseolyticus]PKE17798.1 hypothetical protein CW718_02080 [Macrococcus caseolyticus]PKE26135.1 hypothetical protein CW686_06395 [Macrococcus caseolyticus]
MKYLLAIIIQALLTLSAFAISLIYCMAINTSMDPLALTVTIMFFLMLIIYGGTDAGKLLQDK